MADLIEFNEIARTAIRSQDGVIEREAQAASSAWPAGNAS